MRPGPTIIVLLWLVLGIAGGLALMRSLALPGVELLQMLWQVGLALILLLAWLDLRAERRQPHPEVSRNSPSSLALGRKNQIRLHITNHRSYHLRGRVTDHFPSRLTVLGIPVNTDIPAGGELELVYSVVPIARGEAVFAQAELELISPWGFWRCRHRGAQKESLRIYPDFMTLSSMNELSFEQSVALLGIHLQRQRGEGTDFLQLREFRDGDPLRQVDWKASSRQAKLISREYQDEHDQDVIFLLDCGRRMHGQSRSMSHFDHSLNAILLTAYFALRQGDAVGVCCFAGEDLWIKPVKHCGGINLLLDQLYNLQTSTESTDFLEATRKLAARQHKRALVIVISTVQPEDRQDLSLAMDILAARHAVIMANVREHDLEHELTSEVANFESALTHAVAVGLQRDRHLVLENLQGRGAWVVDSLPEQLNYNLVLQYLALKRAGVV